MLGIRKIIGASGVPYRYIYSFRGLFRQGEWCCKCFLLQGVVNLLCDRNFSAGENGLKSKRKKHGSDVRSRALALGVLGLFALCIIAAASAYFLAQQNEKNLAEDQSAQILEVTPSPVFVESSAESKERPLYPLSVIPRGVADAQELKMALAHDPIASAHYAGFSVMKAAVITVQKPRAVYVSYRSGNQIYWTRSRMWLHRGETLISDGRNSARTRCGNRISEVPLLPVSAHEPPLKMLEEPAALPDPLFESNPPSPIWLAGTQEPLPPGVISNPPPVLGGPPIWPVLCCGGLPLPPPNTPPVVVPPVVTPEPGVWMLMISGIVFVYLVRKK